MPFFRVWKVGVDPFSTHLYGQECGVAILPALVCLQQCRVGAYFPFWPYYPLIV